jgi:hypothetical protein
MKHLYLSFVVALALAAGHLSGGGALAAPPFAETHQNTLAGRILPQGSSSLSLGAEASGALPGSFTVSLNLDSTTVTGGRWRLVAKRVNEDGSQSEVGVIEGAVSGGAVSLSADGRVASLVSVQLAVEGGTGNYAGLTRGSGTLAGGLNREASPQFSGSLNLDF